MSTGQNESGTDKDLVKTEKGISKQMLMLGLVAVVFAVWAIVNQVRNRTLRDKIEAMETSNSMAIDSLRAASESLFREFNRQNSMRDSLERILRPLEPYRPLVGMLNYRDSVQSALPFSAGDRVIVLPDTIPAIIKEVLLTGTGNSFSIEYLVVLKGGVERSVPALLLEKK